MRALKLTGGEWSTAGRRLWRTAGVTALSAALGLCLTSTSRLGAQESDAVAETNDVVAAEVLARLSELVHAAEFGPSEDLAAPDNLAATNGLPQAASPTQAGSHLRRSDHSDSTNRLQASGRSQADDRRSRGRRSSRSGADQPRTPGSSSDSNRAGERIPTNTVADTPAGSARLNYSAFKVIVDRNIFDPNRLPSRPGESRARSAPKTVDSLTLVGTMSYERGAFAFFDGTSAEYKKALKLRDVIAGYRLSNIAPNRVKLAAGTNELELGLGMQLRREEDGPWLLASHSDSYAPLPASASTNTPPAAMTATGTNAPSASAEAESDIIKKLMQRREQE